MNDWLTLNKDDVSEWSDMHVYLCIGVLES